MWADEEGPMAQSISRRTFFGTAVGAAGLLAGGWESNAQVALSVGASPWIEATIPQLQRLMRARELTSRQLTLAYLHRINRLDGLLGSGDRDESARRRDRRPTRRRASRRALARPAPRYPSTGQGQHRNR